EQRMGYRRKIVDTFALNPATAEDNAALLGALMGWDLSHEPPLRLFLGQSRGALKTARARLDLLRQLLYAPNGMLTVEALTKLPGSDDIGRTLMGTGAIHWTSKHDPAHRQLRILASGASRFVASRSKMGPEHMAM